MATRKPRTKRGKRAKVSRVMHEFKAGSLHSGRSKKRVRSRRQAIAIALRSAGVSRRRGARKRR